MRIPDEVKIGAHLLKINEEIDPSNDDDNCFGCISQQKLTITLNKFVAHSQKE